MVSQINDIKVETLKAQMHHMDYMKRMIAISDFKVFKLGLQYSVEGQTEVSVYCLSVLQYITRKNYSSL